MFVKITFWFSVAGPILNENSESTFMFAAHTKVVVVVRRVQKRKVSLLFYGSKYDAMLWRTLTHSAVNSEKNENSRDIVLIILSQMLNSTGFLKFWFIFIFGAMCFQ